MHQFDHNDLTYAAKRYPDIIGWIPDVRGKNGKINPHLTRFVTKRGSMVDVFHVKPVYYETLTGHWRPLSEVCEHYGNHRIVFHAEAFNKIHPRYLRWLLKRQELLKGEVLFTSPFGRLTPTKQYLQEFVTVPRIGLTTTTVYPDPNTETTTFDGGIGNIFNASGTSLALAQAKTSTTNYNDTAINLQEADYGEAVAYVRAPSGQHYPMRSAVLFDTSSIGSDTIDSTTLSIYGKVTTQDAMNDVYGYVGVVSFDPTSNTGWSSDDITFSKWGVSTEFSSGIDITSWSTSGYNDYAFNASGEAYIDGSGITKLGLMHGRDIQSQNWTGGAANSIVDAASADATGTSTDPKLVVEHTASAGPIYNALAFCSF